MRLIDADKVKQYALTEGFYCDTDADKEATAEAIDRLFPTIDAIPEEWIEEKAKMYDRLAEYAKKQMWGEIYSEWAHLLRQMVVKWREGNGTDRQEQTP